jgi:hypothetical protein
MARPPKGKVDPIDVDELRQKATQIQIWAENLVSCVARVKGTKTLYVEYLDSLDRAYERLGAFEPKLRDSVAMLERGFPLMPANQVSSKPAKTVAEQARLSARHADAIESLGPENAVEVGKRARKSPPEPIKETGRKRKAN